MHVRSIGLGTDLELARTRGTVVDRDDYLVVTTPDDPSYYYGNLLVLPAAPQVGEVAYWTRRFAAELGTNPDIRHVALRWDGIHGDAGATDELTAAGFTIEHSVVMTARSITAPPSPYLLRPLYSRELPATAELEFADSEVHDDLYRRFLHRRAAWKQRLVEDGTAAYWGAFDAGVLVASLGLVPLGACARYQDVQTATTHRKQGIASALLAAAAAGAPERELVIVAEPGSAAERLYQRVGFRAIERIAAALRRPT
ncbi:MAG: GNAT family N-acetyltransferase [Kofleriaceae bacterium]|nr:GNAT family N-acetyltransferase [Kofleriaceae bacterium]